MTPPIKTPQQIFEDHQAGRKADPSTHVQVSNHPDFPDVVTRGFDIFEREIENRENANNDDWLLVPPLGKPANKTG